MDIVTPPNRVPLPSRRRRKAQAAAFATRQDRDPAARQSSRHGRANGQPFDGSSIPTDGRSMLRSSRTPGAFCDGHVRAFAFFGGVPKSILYDNTKIAVARILGDGKRQRTRGFTELQSHYLFEDRFGRPGKGNDKGAKISKLINFNMAATDEIVAIALKNTVVAGDDASESRARGVII